MARAARCSGLLPGPRLERREADQRRHLATRGARAFHACAARIPMRRHVIAATASTSPEKCATARARLRMPVEVNVVTSVGHARRASLLGGLVAVVGALAICAFVLAGKRGPPLAAAQSASSVAPADLAANKEFHQREHRELIARHAREPRDQAWASATAQRLRDVLQPIVSGSGAALLGVDCRTSTCVAKVEWRNLPAAISGWPAVLNGDYGCGVRVTLDDARNPGARFPTDVLFSCPNPNAQ